jgi:hypothetical protein
LPEDLAAQRPVTNLAQVKRKSKETQYTKPGSLYNNNNYNKSGGDATYCNKQRRPIRL